MTTLFKSSDIATFVSEISERTERIQLIKVYEYFTGKSCPKASMDQVVAKLAKIELDEDFVYCQIMDENDMVMEDMMKVNELNHAHLIMKLADMCEEKVRKAPSRQVRKGGKSHAEKLIDFFANNSTATREELMKLLDTDARNVNVAVSILRNPKRTKNPLNVQYDRSTKTFVLSN